MQTLKFNTTEKIVHLYDGNLDSSKLLTQITDVPTVKVQEGYYEVMQKEDVYGDVSASRTIPVLRVPIANTNMIIEK